MTPPRSFALTVRLAGAVSAMAHFEMLDPGAPVDSRWRVVFTLLGIATEDVPIGSKLRVPMSVKIALER